MIELKNVTIEKNDKTILNNVSLEIEKGKNTIIMGPSGAGKSSILKVILGLWMPDEGNVLFEGRDICQMNDNELLELRKNIGMVFQGNALFDSLTVADNILYFLPDKRKYSEAELKKKIDELLSFVNLSGAENLYPEELSGGMKKRVAIARALAFNPKVILFDEPTTGLDPINTASVLELIDKLKVKGSTSVIVTHIIDDAMEIGDKFIVINRGEVADSGNLQKILNSSNSFVNQFFLKRKQLLSERISFGA
ncbi:ABC transporter-like protein [Melioribacter roseus P3M-2]|uniref:ABC transporter-like protein n=1 Tax=Melioribacter roseus (strain DSM 23840 / JCM 17771 / VKM B-2668 / P3M-2) TaxID=1191523 RepID=I6YVC5_MELRP|nr:ATP-binding cassette domain-containing protein [Melioribacter roseus]AFN74497.1 ABC transporter-like protein [Melioribacter roseus P3M-2]